MHSTSSIKLIDVINVPQKFNFEISLIHWLQLGLRTFLGDRFHGSEPSRRTLRPVKRKTETKIISARTNEIEPWQSCGDIHFPFICRTDVLCMTGKEQEVVKNTISH